MCVVFIFFLSLSWLNIFPYLSINTVWSSLNFLSSGEGIKYCKKLNEFSVKYVLWKTSTCSHSYEFLCQHYMTKTSDIPCTIIETTELPRLWIPFIALFVHYLTSQPPISLFWHFVHWGFPLRFGGLQGHNIASFFPQLGLFEYNWFKIVCSRDKYVSPFSYQRILF